MSRWRLTALKQLVLMDWLLTVVPQYHTTEASPSHHAWYKHNYFAPGGVRSIVMSMSVCLSVHSHNSKLHGRSSPYFCASYLWLGPPPTAL